MLLSPSLSYSLIRSPALPSAGRLFNEACGWQGRTADKMVRAQADNKSRTSSTSRSFMFCELPETGHGQVLDHTAILQQAREFRPGIVIY
jgi:hypothetical protein